MDKLNRPFKFNNKTWKNKKQLYMYYCFPILKNPLNNIKYGIAYLKVCFEKANGNLSETARYYNQGTGGKYKDYRNWVYVNRILKKYSKVTIQKLQYNNVLLADNNY